MIVEPSIKGPLLIPLHSFIGRTLYNFEQYFTLRQWLLNLLSKCQSKPWLLIQWAFTIGYGNYIPPMHIPACNGL